MHLEEHPQIASRRPEAPWLRPLLRSLAGSSRSWTGWRRTPKSGGCAALSEDHAAVEVEESLDNLLDRMALIRAENLNA